MNQELELKLSPPAEPQVHRGGSVQRQPVRDVDREREGGGRARQALHPRRQRQRHQAAAGRKTLPHRNLRQVSKIICSCPHDFILYCFLHFIQIQVRTQVPWRGYVNAPLAAINADIK